MRKFFALLKVNFFVMLAALSVGSNKKRALSGWGALALLAGLALYLSGIYSFMLADAMAQANVLDFLLPMMAIFACVMAITMTVFAAGGLIFGGKDNDLMLSLPVNAFTVMLSKLLALYLEDFVFCGMWMLPTAIAYCVKGGTFSFWFVLRLLWIIVFMPLIPTLLGMLFGFVNTYISARFERKALFSSVLYFVFFGAIMVLAFQVNRLPMLIVTNASAIGRALQTWLLPFGLLTTGLADGSILALLGFAAICCVPFLAIVYAMSRVYKKLLTTLSARKTRNDFKLQGVAAQGQFAALFKKEAGRFFGTPIYLFNTGFGVVMLIIGTGYLCFSRAKLLPMLAAMSGVGSLVPLLAGAFCFIVSTVCISCVSISLEGKTLWILKEAPIPVSRLFLAKAWLNFAVAFFPAALCLIPIAIVFAPLSLMELLVTVLLLAALSLHISLSGLVANLLMPKMNCENDTLVVKQSFSSVLCTLGGMAVVGAAGGLYIWVGHLMGFTAYALLCTAVLAVLCFAEWRWLRGAGTKRLLAL